MADPGRAKISKFQIGEDETDLSHLRPDYKILAVLCSDLHFQMTPPIWRSNEPDWFEAMERPWRTIKDVATTAKAPIVIAGDINDRWNSPPELINWMIRVMKYEKGIYAIPGQHDLTHHRYEDIKKSAYWTLCEAGIILNLKPNEPWAVPPHLELNHCLTLYGFPWGYPIKPRDPKTFKDDIHLAVIHDYCWAEGKGYLGCPPNKHWKVHAENLRGYTVAVFGDNHNGFLVHPKKNGLNSILNCGSLMRRSTDQKDYRPRFGLIWSDGYITDHQIDISKDQTLDQISLEDRAECVETLDEFLSIIDAIGNDIIPDFKQACLKFMVAKKTPKNLQQIILEMVEEETTGKGK